MTQPVYVEWVTSSKAYKEVSLKHSHRSSTENQSTHTQLSKILNYRVFASLASNSRPAQLVFTFIWSVYKIKSVSHLDSHSSRHCRVKVECVTSGQVQVQRGCNRVDRANVAANIHSRCRSCSWGSAVSSLVHLKLQRYQRNKFYLILWSMSLANTAVCLAGFWPKVQRVSETGR